MLVNALIQTGFIKRLLAAFDARLPFYFVCNHPKILYLLMIILTLE